MWLPSRGVGRAGAKIRHQPAGTPVGGADKELETVRARLKQADQLSALKREADRRSAQR